MPTSRRRFYLKYLAKKKEEENKKQHSGGSNTPKTHLPNIPQARKRPPRKH